MGHLFLPSPGGKKGTGKKKRWIFLSKVSEKRRGKGLFLLFKRGVRRKKQMGGILTEEGKKKKKKNRYKRNLILNFQRGEKEKAIKGKKKKERGTRLPLPYLRRLREKKKGESEAALLLRRETGAYVPAPTTRNGNGGQKKQAFSSSFERKGG